MHNKKTTAFVALGTNAPHRGVEGAVLLSQVLAAMEVAELRVLRVSSAWESAPWPPSGQAMYVNAVALIETGTMEPAAIYARLAEIEAAFGRVRRERWGARTLDLDIVDWSGAQGDFDGIELPHPRAHERAFVLAPLAELAPEWRHPVLERTAGDLLAGLNPPQQVRLLGPISH